MQEIKSIEAIKEKLRKREGQIDWPEEEGEIYDSQTFKFIHTYKKVHYRPFPSNKLITSFA